MADIEIVHRKSYIVHRTSYIVNRTSYIVNRTSYIVNRTSYIVHRKSYIVHRTSYIVNRTSYIVHRTSYILLVLFFSLNASTAQSWSPINRYEKMNFSQVPLNYISNTVWVDSARVSGSDSVFYFNRIVTNCDTCLATYRLCNQPGFLKKNMYKRSGGTYEFRYPGSVVIKTLASPGRQKPWR